MDKREIFARLMECPEAIRTRQLALHESLDLLQQVEREQKEVEAHYLLMEDGPINGKNEQVRLAQLFEKTQPERLRTEELRRVVAHREIAVQAAQNEFQMLLALTACLARDP